MYISKDPELNYKLVSWKYTDNRWNIGLYPALGRNWKLKN